MSRRVLLVKLRACLWRDAFFVWCSPRELCKWKQFTMLLEEGFGFVAIFHLPPPSPYMDSCPAQAVPGLLVYYLNVSVVGGIEVRQPLGNLVSPLGCRA